MTEETIDTEPYPLRGLAKIFFFVSGFSTALILYLVFIYEPYTDIDFSWVLLVLSMYFLGLAPVAYGLWYSHRWTYWIFIVWWLVGLSGFSYIFYLFAIFPLLILLPIIHSMICALIWWSMFATRKTTLKRKHETIADRDEET